MTILGNKIMGDMTWRERARKMFGLQEQTHETQDFQDRVDKAVCKIDNLFVRAITLCPLDDPMMTRAEQETARGVHDTMRIKGGMS